MQIKDAGSRDSRARHERAAKIRINKYNIVYRACVGTHDLYTCI